MTITASPTEVPVSTRMPLERLEARLIELSSQIAGAMCAFLLLVAAYDDAEGWRSWGLRSTADWLSWKCGLGKNAAREQVRVARAMRDFPRLVELFGAGRLSYSKVRSITRAATPDTIDTFIDWALACPAAELERLIAAHRKSSSDSNTRKRQATQSVSCRWAEDGMLVATVRLAPEEGARFVAALDAAKATEPDSSSDVEAAAEAAIPACAPCRDAAIRGHDGCDGTTASHRRFAHVGVSAETVSCEAVIDAIARAGCADVSEKEIERRAEARSAANALLHILDQAKRADRADRAEAPNADPERYLAVVHVSAETSSPEADGGQLEDGPRLPACTTDRVTCGCPYVVQTDDRHGNPLHLGRKTRRIRGRLAKAIRRRDNGRCQGPGCERAATQCHHIRHWRCGGPTCIENLISLCDGHHWLAHEGGWSIGVVAPGRWLFQRADGVVVPATGSAPLHVAPLPHDAAVAAEAIAPAWDGNRVIDDAVEWLGRRQALNAERSAT